MVFACAFDKKALFEYQWVLQSGIKSISLISEFIQLLMAGIDVKGIIDFYYPEENELKKIYMVHAEKVAGLALEMARNYPELDIDIQFLEEAAMLHDLGIFLTDAPRIHCFGTEDYLCHGYLGAELLRSRGHERHARVCERHTGTGLTKEIIAEKGWNLPVKDFVPETLEEQLICFADKFYSKTKFLEQRRSFEQVVESMRKISEESVRKVEEWAAMFL